MAWELQASGYYAKASVCRKSSLFNESIQRQHVWPFEGKKMKERGVFCSPGLGVQRGIDNQHGEISTPGELSGG